MPWQTLIGESKASGREGRRVARKRVKSLVVLNMRSIIHGTFLDTEPWYGENFKLKLEAAHQWTCCSSSKHHTDQIQRTGFRTSDIGSHYCLRYVQKDIDGKSVWSSSQRRLIPLFTVYDWIGSQYLYDRNSWSKNKQLGLNIKRRR